MFEVRGALMADNDYRREGMNFSIPLKDSRIISAHAATLSCPTPIYSRHCPWAFSPDWDSLSSFPGPVIF